MKLAFSTNAYTQMPLLTAAGWESNRRDLKALKFSPILHTLIPTRWMEP